MAGIFDDAAFNNINFDSYSNSADSPFDASRYFNLGAADSPDYQPRTPSKSLQEQDTSSGLHTQQQQYPPRSLISSHSAESSSQDSLSESSVRRKRKTTSESPPTENLAGLKMNNTSRMQSEEDMNANYLQQQQYGGAAGGLSLDQDMMSTGMDMNSAFDFESAASSPGALDSGIGAFSGHPAMKTMAHRGPPVRCFLFLLTA